MGPSSGAAPNSFVSCSLACCSSAELRALAWAWRRSRWRSRSTSARCCLSLGLLPSMASLLADSVDSTNCCTLTARFDRSNTRAAARCAAPAGPPAQEAPPHSRRRLRQGKAIPKKHQTTLWHARTPLQPSTPQTTLQARHTQARYALCQYVMNTCTTTRGVNTRGHTSHRTRSHPHLTLARLLDAEAGKEFVGVLLLPPTSLGNHTATHSRFNTQGKDFQCEKGCSSRQSSRPPPTAGAVVVHARVEQKRPHPRLPPLNGFLPLRSQQKQSLRSGRQSKKAPPPCFPPARTPHSAASADHKRQQQCTQTRHATPCARSSSQRAHSCWEPQACPAAAVREKKSKVERVESMRSLRPGARCRARCGTCRAS